MHPSDPGQRAAIAVTALFFAVATQLVLVLLPLRLALDVGLAPAAYGALGGIAASAYAFALLLGRYLTSRTPGRAAIVLLGAVVAVLAPTLLLGTRTPLGIAVSVVLGVAALGTSRAAWNALVEASGARGAAGAAGQVGLVLGQLGAVLLVLLEVSPARGIEVGSGTGLIGVAVLVLAVGDRRAPLAPRTSATLARARQALTMTAVRRMAGLGAMAGFVLTGGGITLVATPGTVAAPILLVVVTALAGTCCAVTGNELELRAAAAVEDGLAQAARAVVGHALIVGAGCAALVTGLWAQTVR